MKHIKFLGASGTVTGSSYHLYEKGKPGLLVDLGMFMGEEEITQLNYKLLELDASSLAGAVLTHAHLDHCGRLPLLTLNGFTGTIYMTAATQRLLELTLYDAAKIAENDADKQVIYTKEDVDELMEKTYVVDYGQSFNVGQYAITLQDAGHILGSATAEVVDREATDGVEKIVFSGDLGNSPQDIVRPTQLIGEADLALIETTYGNRIHGDEDPHELIAGEVEAILKSNGTLIIPSFSLQRTQELLHIFDHLKSSGKIPLELPVFLDSPMAIKATKIYGNFSTLFNEELTEHVKSDDPFDFPGLQLTLRHQDSKEISNIEGAKVIIAGSGMMVGGRILHHAKRYLPEERNRILFVGYQGYETLGREILEGNSPVVIDGSEIPVAAHVGRLSSMSAHADQPKLLNWLEHVKGLKKAFLVHGEEESRQEFSTLLQEKMPELTTVLPALNEDLPLSY